MNLIKKAWHKLTGKKSAVSAFDVFDKYLNSFLSGGINISPFQALEFYNMVSPVSTGIDMIADEFSGIKPHIYNIKTEKFEDEKSPELLKLLRNPNADKTKSEFMKSVAVFFLSTGNQYIIATGQVDKPPLEIIVVPSQNVNIQGSTKDSFADSYQISDYYAPLFKRDEKPSGLRYYHKDIQELWHIKGFSDGISTPLYLGKSKLNGIYYEIKQHLQASIHNYALLCNGARPDGALMVEAELGKDQRNILREEINRKIQGAENAGEIFLFSGGKMDYKEMSQKLKDMDFRNLKNDVTASVFNRLKIPQPLVNPEFMTLANYEKAQLALYDNAVLPFTDRIYEELTNFLFPRYKIDINTYKLFYDQNEISALETRLNENINKLRDSNVLTINEIRALFNYENVDGGDFIYQNIGLVPIGTTPLEKTTKERFINILKGYTDKQGKRLYSDEEATAMAEQYIESEQHKRPPIKE